MSDIVLDKKLQLKTKMCLLIKVSENKQFSLSHTSATFWMLLTKKAVQAVESSDIPWSDSCPEILQDLEQTQQMASLLKGNGGWQQSPRNIGICIFYTHKKIQAWKSALLLLQ